MAKSPVKFYAVSSLPESTANNNLYFVTGGELYKGATRFGAARVFVYSAATSEYVLSDGNNTTTYSDLAAIEASNAAARGDIAIDANSQTFVYDGSNWVSAGTTSQYVDSQIDSKIASLGNVMRFTGVVQAIPTTSVQDGDIVVVGSEPTGYINTTTGVPTTTSGEGIASLVQGQEYVCVDAENKKWELIGDQNTGATKGYVDDALSYSSAIGVTSGATTLSGAVQALATAVDGALTEISAPNSGSGNLVTASAVVGYVSGTRWNASDTAYPIGEGENRPSIAVEIDESAEKKVVVTAINFGTAVGANVVTLAQDETLASKSSSSDLPTASQVVEFVASKIESLGNAAQSTVLIEFPGQGDDDGLVTANTIAGYVQTIVGDISASSIDYTAYYDDASGGGGFSGGVTYSTKTVEAAIQALDEALAGIGEAQVSAGTATTTSQTVVFSVTFSPNAAPSMTVTGLGATASMAVATSIGLTISQGTDGEPGYMPAATDAKLATEKAVRDAIEAARTEFQMVWYDDEDANNEGSGTENP